MAPKMSARQKTKNSFVVGRNSRNVGRHVYFERFLFTGSSASRASPIAKAKGAAHVKEISCRQATWRSLKAGQRCYHGKCELCHDTTFRAVVRAFASGESYLSEGNKSSENSSDDSESSSVDSRESAQSFRDDELFFEEPGRPRNGFYKTQKGQERRRPTQPPRQNRSRGRVSSKGDDTMHSRYRESNNGNYGRPATDFSHNSHSGGKYRRAEYYDQKEDFNRSRPTNMNNEIRSTNNKGSGYRVRNSYTRYAPKDGQYDQREYRMDRKRSHYREDRDPTHRGFRQKSHVRVRPPPRNNADNTKQSSNFSHYKKARKYQSAHSQDRQLADPPIYTPEKIWRPPPPPSPRPESTWSETDRFQKSTGRRSTLPLPTNLQNTWLEELICNLNSIRFSTRFPSNDIALEDLVNTVDDRMIEDIFQESAEGREEYIDSKHVTLMLKFIKRLEVALKVFRMLQEKCKYRSQWNNVWAYSTLLVKCARWGYWNVAKSLLDECWSNGVQPNDLTLSCALSACTKADRNLDGIEIFEKSKVMGGGADLVSYNIAIIMYRRTGEWERAIALILEMWSSNITPDASSYEQALKACYTGKSVKDAMRLLDEIEKMAIEPTEMTLMRLLDVADICDDFEIAFQMRKRLENLGIKMNVLHYRCLIGLVSRKCQLENREEILQDLIGEMLESVDDWSSLSYFTAGINASVIAEMPQKAIELFKIFRDSGLAADDRMYSSVAAALDAVNGWEAALELLKEGESAGVPLTVYTYTAVITSVARANKWEMVKKLMEDMKRLDVQPNEKTYCAAMIACEIENDWDKCYWLLGQMASNLPHPKSSTHSSNMHSSVLSQAIGIMWNNRFYMDVLRLILEKERSGFKLVNFIDEHLEDGKHTSIDLHGITAGAAVAYTCILFLRLKRRPDIYHDKIDLVTGWGRHTRGNRIPDSSDLSVAKVSIREALEQWLKEKGCPIIASSFNSRDNESVTSTSKNEGRLCLKKKDVLTWLSSYDDDFIKELFPGDNISLPEATLQVLISNDNENENTRDSDVVVVGSQDT